MSMVSVIMPMKNARPFVAEALRSVLADEVTPLQVIVVNDGSEDGSPQVVQSIGDRRVSMIEGPRRGIAAAFNAGLAVAGGEIIMRCDADDRFPPGRIAQQVTWLAQHPEAIAVCGRFQTISPRGERAAVVGDGTSPRPITDELLDARTQVHLCSYAVRGDVLRRIGGCRSWFVTAEDLDLQFRLAEAGPIYYLPQVFYEYRLHDESITHRQANTQRQFYEHCARRFARQRRETGEDDLMRGTPPMPPAPGGRRGSASRQVQLAMVGEAWREHGVGNKRAAVGLAWRACIERPINVVAWKSLLLLILRPTPGHGGERSP